MRGPALWAALLVLVLALVPAGCGASDPAPDPGGSTLRSTYTDADGDGRLASAPGEPLLDRTELGAPAPAGPQLARLAQLTDAHVRDEESPARAPFLDRLGAPFTSVFRPQEALTAQVLVAAVRSIAAFGPGAVLESGDLADNSQRNELDAATTALNGGVVDPGSGRRAYQGVQSAANADPFYYRPDVDAPRHPGLLAAAQRPLRSPGLGARWLPATGNHDVLVDGEIAPTPRTRALAVGDHLPGDPPPGQRIPRDPVRARRLVDRLLARGDVAPGARVAPDARRAELGEGAVARLRRAARVGGGGRYLDYTADAGPRVRVVVLDTARRGAGSGGIVRPEQLSFLRSALRGAGDRWVLIVSHHRLAGADGGARATALLDRDPRVLAAISGHTHRNRITPRRTAAGGYWQIETASLADYPQQARALRVLSTRGGGALIETWMLDTAPAAQADLARQLAFLDAQGGRPDRASGDPRDRNVRLWRAPAR
jgi:3',5'-cyclic AMP phosphodiesterase CpdA